jgi:hypothetical protein
MPPPSQVISVGDATLPKIMFLSAISKVVELSVTVVPLTVKLPLRTNDVPVAAPILGVTKVGEVSTTNFVPVPVCEAIEVAFPTEVITPVKFALVVTVAALPVVFWFKVGKVQFVKVPLDGVPRAGVINVGLVFITKVEPVPVWFATEVALPTEVIGPVKFALVVTVAAFPVVDWLRVGKSLATAIEGTPVAVVFFNIPVAKAARL